MKTFLKSIIVAVLLTFPASLSAGEKEAITIGWCENSYIPPEYRPSIGLALSGGGARGLAQIGVIKAFEEAGLNIRAISGTSIGGIVGGLFASGYTAGELEQIIDSLDFTDLFSNRPGRTSMFTTQREERERSLISIRFDGLMPHIPQALTAGQILSNILSRLTMKANYISGCNFSRLKIPFRAATTDLVTGEKVVIDSGNLADAMRSTMAFPLAFTGVETADRILMDGGMVDPIPVDIVREMDSNLNLIIAINTASELLPREKINDPLDIANQATSIMTMDKLKNGLALADYVVTPIGSLFDAGAFDQAEDLINAGYIAGRKAAEKIAYILDSTGNRDSLLIGRITLAGAPSDIFMPDQFQTGQKLTRNELWRLAGQLYRENSLFCLSIKIDTLHIDSLNNRIVGLIVNFIPRPKLSETVIDIAGNTVISDSTIISFLKVYGNEITPESLVRFSDELARLYNAGGYDLMHVKNISYDPDESIIRVAVDEAVINKIHITGNGKTKTWLIKSNLPLREGRPFSSRQTEKGIANIYATDLFERVTVNVIQENDGAAVYINVTEKVFTQVRLGWHWDDEYKSEQFIELLHDNLLGTGQQLLTHWQYANHRQKYDLSLKADRFFSTSLTYRIGGYYHVADRKIYNSAGSIDTTFRENRLGVQFTLGSQMARFGTLTGTIRWEEIRNKFFPAQVVEKTRLRSLTFRSLVETIDQYPFPEKGKKHELYVQFTTDILGGETGYTKIFSSIESYFPLLGRLNFHPKASLGLINSKVGIPYTEQFHLGGHFSFSGYNTDELAGAKMVLGNMELRIKLPLRFYLYGRYDFGDVFSSITQITLNNIRHGYGFSLAFDSPLGPIDFGYGKSGKHQEIFYIDIGLLF